MNQLIDVNEKLRFDSLYPARDGRVLTSYKKRHYTLESNSYCFYDN